MPLREVAILGAGLIGSSIAWRLAQAGVPVVLYDAGSFGGETSSAGAGMLSPGGEFDKPSRWLDLGVESMRMYPAFVNGLQTETNLAIDFKVCGCRQFVEPEQSQRRAEFQASKGIDVKLEPTGLYYSADGYVDPTDLLRALRCSLVARQVRIVENHSFDQTEASDFAAVVLAAGAWSKQIQVAFHSTLLRLPDVKPIKGHLIGFELAPGSLTEMLRRGHTYLLQRSTGFTLAGSNEEDVGFDRSVNPDTCHEIHRSATDLFPALESAVPARSWVGFRPYSPDGPHIGQVPGTNVWLAYGHYRNGILLTPLTAQRVASEIVAFL